MCRHRGPEGATTVQRRLCYQPRERERLQVSWQSGGQLLNVEVCGKVITRRGACLARPGSPGPPIGWSRRAWPPTFVLGSQMTAIDMFARRTVSGRNRRGGGWFWHRTFAMVTMSWRLHRQHRPFGSIGTSHRRKSRAPSRDLGCCQQGSA